MSTASASQQVSVSVTGASVPVSISFSGNTNNAFSETDTCGTNPAGSTMIAPPGCAINVTYTPKQPAGSKETATLNVSAGGSFSVSLTGSLGSILLFKSVNVGLSNGGATLQNMVTFNTTTLALSCPAGSSATLSSSPDGSGNVLVDNFITVQMGSNLPPQTNVNQIANSNVCPANLGNPADSGQADCFTAAYQGPAGNNQLNGVNPDTITNAGNPTLGGAAGGVPPITLTGFTSNTATTPTTTISMLDGGGYVASSSLFLVTQCVPQGVAAGDTVTGNPVNPNDPSTLNQSYIFDSVNGQNSQFTSDIAGNPDVAPAGTQQITKVFPIPQKLFNQLVSGTSAAPSVCVRLNSVTDPSGATMCEGFLVQCWDPTHTTLSGDNCTPHPNGARNLFDFAGYDSTDTPPGQDYLGIVGSNGTTKSACGGIATNCAQTVIGSTASSTMLVGPGLLLGGDQWLCAPLNPPTTTLANCQDQANLTTANTPPTAYYATANCVLTGSLAGDPCPLNPLTQFKGAADPTHGITTSGKNSIFVPVVNMPLPFTETTIPGRNTAGWVQTPAPVATFVSNEANYVAQTGNPVANSFVATPPYSVTYGIASASSPAPDTTFAVPGDSVNYNANTIGNFGTPLCNTLTPPPPSFTSMSTPLTLAVAQGVYDLHYFTTDCALSEELLFQPTGPQQSDATANWASFRTIAFGVDSQAPTVGCTAPTPNGANNWYTSAPIVSCTATDDYSGFAPGAAVANNGCNSAISSDCIVLQGSLSKPLTSTVSGTGLTAQVPVPTILDLAGNTSTSQPAYPTPIDTTAPTFAATFSVSGTTFNVGQAVTGTFTCGDSISGVAVCGTQTVSACPATSSMTGGAGVGLSSFNTPVAIDTSAGAVGMHTVRAVNCAGLPSTTSVTYNVMFGSTELVIANIANGLQPVKNGGNLTYKIFVLDLSANQASNVVVTNPIPANTTYVSAISGIVSCSLAGCNDLTTGSTCSHTATVVTCSTPTVKPILPGLTGFVIKLVVKVNEPKVPATITDTATVTSSNPDPIKGDNTVTVSTKVTQ
ncbi:MAG TPA: hypothetical protein VMP12_05995 [Candidatus Sulfotelmatobacter sp.]|nr:hypothetical protein [Candidatus Sulfotelmatobacter sp.]